MPIPQQVIVDMNMYMFYQRRIGKRTKFSFLPRRCYLSNKPLWFKKSVVVTSMVTGPGKPVFETYWCDPKEFFIDQFRREKWDN